MKISEEQLTLSQILVGKVSHVFGDDKAMVDSAKHPDAGINKRHTILSFHYVRGLTARGFLAINHIISGSNVADIVSKHWSHKSAWPLIKPMFNHEGDTGELYVDDIKMDNSSSERGVLRCNQTRVRDSELSEYHLLLQYSRDT